MNDQSEVEKMAIRIIDRIVIWRWILTALLISIFAWDNLAMLRGCLIISSIFCELYWYLWQSGKQSRLAELRKDAI